MARPNRQNNHLQPRRPCPRLYPCHHREQSLKTPGEMGMLLRGDRTIIPSDLPCRYPTQKEKDQNCACHSNEGMVTTSIWHCMSFCWAHTMSGPTRLSLRWEPPFPRRSWPPPARPAKSLPTTLGRLPNCDLCQTRKNSSCKTPHSSRKCLNSAPLTLCHRT